MRPALKVVHLCTNDVQGGAARSAYRLHKAMQEAGISSRMCVKNKLSRDPSVSVLQMRRSLKRLRFRGRHDLDQRLLLKIRERRRSTLMFSLDMVPWSHEGLPGHDILNLHWVSGFVDYVDLGEMLPDGGKFVWTFHDMNPLTGGCHFPGDCRKYEASCSKCPLLESGKDHDVAWRAWNRKKHFYDTLNNRQVSIVSPSRWLATAAQSSPFLQRQKVSVIPYGIDLDIYRPGDGNPMRSILNIPADARVILVLAARLSDVRKGGEPFFRALASSGVLGSGKATLLTVGRDMPSLGDSVPHRDVGSVENEHFLAGLYNCADVLLMPTLDDNLPNAALEAIACGLPVVSYDTGGMSDIIGEQEAGILVPKGDVGALLGCAQSLLGDTGILRQKITAARIRAERFFSQELQAARYRSLYEELLENGGARDFTGNPHGEG